MESGWGTYGVDGRKLQRGGEVLEPPSTRETVSQNAFVLVRSRADRRAMQLWNTKVLVNEVQV